MGMIKALKIKGCKAILTLEVDTGTLVLGQAKQSTSASVLIQHADLFSDYINPSPFTAGCGS